MRFLLFGIAIFSFALSAHGQGIDRGHGRSVDRVHTYQDNHVIFGKNNVSLSLFPLIVRGFEINYDRRIVERHWLKLAPVYYRMQDYRASAPSDIKRMQGYGFKFQHKYFPYANTDKKLGVFLSYGPGFQQFDIEAKDEKSLSFSKIGFECVIGVRQVFSNVFYFEIYAGMATNYVNTQKGETEYWQNILEKQNSMWFDYARTGNFMVFGISLGVLF